MILLGHNGLDCVVAQCVSTRLARLSCSTPKESCPRYNDIRYFGIRVSHENLSLRSWDHRIAALIFSGIDCNSLAMNSTHENPSRILSISRNSSANESGERPFSFRSASMSSFHESRSSPFPSSLCCVGNEVHDESIHRHVRHTGMNVYIIRI